MTDVVADPSDGDEGTLAGVVVIENAKGVGASYAGRILALMGATVIKLEPPRRGDPLRYEVPLLDDASDSGVLFNYLNVGKSSVTLDIASAAGRSVLDEMLRRADIFIDDTAPSDRTAAGLDPAALCARHGRLIYASVLPFGAMGPHADYHAHELNVFHSGGEGYLLPNGLALEMFPDRPPVKIYGHFAELVGGLSAASGILAALLVQDEGGQFVDISEQDANVAISCFNVQRVGDGVVEYRAGRSFRYGGVIECADGYVQVITLEQRQWAGLVKLMGEPEWTQDPALKDEIERGRRGAEINAHLRAWAKHQKVSDMVAGGQALGVPIAKYAEPEEVMNSAQTRARGIFTPVDFGALGKVPMITAPYQSTAPENVARYPAHPGADNAKVLCDWLGHTRSELDRWISEQVV